MKKSKVSYNNFFNLETFEGEVYKQEYPWHFHQTYTVIYVLKGNLTYYFRNGTIRMQENDFFIIDPFVSHQNKIPDYCKYKVIFLPCDFFGTFHPVDYPSFSLTRYCFKPHHQLISHFLNFFAPDQELSDNLIGGFKSSMLDNLTYTTHKRLPFHRLSAAVTYINAHIFRKLTVGEIAVTSNLSKYHFQRSFKRKVGLTVHEYIQQRKCEEARALIQKGYDAVTVTYEMGFFDQSHFIRNFKKMWATTPQKWISK